jgi:SAM-dependent methyltransferase
VATAHESGLLTKVRRVKYSVASSGLGRSVLDLLISFLAYNPERDRSFDRRHGTDTSGAVEPSGLGIADAALREKAILYLPSPARVTRWMLENIGLDHREFSFVDLGCGKGRVLLVASEYPFRRIVGVDISTELSEIARRNEARYRSSTRKCREIHVHTQNVLAFDFPEGNLLVHLYHPFDPELTGTTLRRLGESLVVRPRRIVVAYLLYTGAVDRVIEVFASISWLRQRRYEQSITGTYDWLFYSN